MAKQAVAPGVVLCVGLLLVAAPAAAQTVIRGVGVADRLRPDYDPVGRDLGSFVLHPSLAATVDTTDNYRATDVNRLSDAYLTLSPEVRLLSNWNRNRLDGRVFLDQAVHARLPRENATQYGGDVQGVLDVTRRTVLNASLSATHSFESRSTLGSFQNAPEPVRYESYHAAVGFAHELNRLDVDASFGLNVFDFHDVSGFNGTTIDQDYRDVRTTTEAADARYDIGNGLGLIVGATATQNAYPFHPGSPGFVIASTLDRQSSGYRVQGGLTFELSALVFGNIQIGWLNRNYRDVRLQDFSGFSFSGDLLWNVTPLTSLRLHAVRSIEDTSSFSVAGNIRSDVSIAVDHELYRYVILSGDLRYGSFRPNGPGVAGTEYGAGARIRYLLDRHWSATLSARYERRDAVSSFLRYHAATIGLSLKYAY